LYAISGQEDVELLVWDTANHTLVAHHKASVIVSLFLACHPT